MKVVCTWNISTMFSTKLSSNHVLDYGVFFDKWAWSLFRSSYNRLFPFYGAYKGLSSVNTCCSVERVSNLYNRLSMFVVQNFWDGKRVLYELFGQWCFFFLENRRDYRSITVTIGVIPFYGACEVLSSVGRCCFLQRIWMEIRFVSMNLSLSDMRDYWDSNRVLIVRVVRQLRDF